MNTLNEIKNGREIGYNCGYYFIWYACIDCGKEWWVHFKNNKPISLRCLSCDRKHRIYNAKPTLMKNGYYKIKLASDDFFIQSARKDGFIYLHRLVMAKSLGRNLHSWEIVHHKNGDKKDNRIENLQLVSGDKHNQITIMENRIIRLESRITLLEAENVLLQSRIEELCSVNL